MTGITVSVERQASGTGVRDLELRLLKNGVLSGSDKADTATNWTTSDTTVSYGGTSDLWGTTWTPAQINASDFGVSLRVQNTHTSNNRTPHVDAILVSVTYLLPADLPNAANSVVMANPTSRPANGISASTITVQLKNASGGNVTFSGGPVTLTTTRGTLSPVTDNGDGTYSATLTSTSAGLATVRGYLDGTEMGTSATVTFDVYTSFDINYQAINLSGMTLRSGTALQVNAVYEKINAITIRRAGARRPHHDHGPLERLQLRLLPWPSRPTRRRRS